MTKKYFEAPYLKVVNVKNDVIATSVRYSDSTPTDDDPNNNFIQGRRGFFGGEEDWE